MKTRLHKLLHYTPHTSKVSWSPVPGSDPMFSLERMMAGLPPFRIMSEGRGGTDQLKAIIISPLLKVDNLYGRYKRAAQQRIKALMEKGHLVRRYAKGKLIPFNIELLNLYYQKIISPPATSTEKPLTKQALEHFASAELSLPADALLILDKASLEEIILGDDSDWENLSSFEHVDLSNSLISIDSLNHFLSLHGKHIKSLNLGNCIHLQEGKLDGTIQLPDLEDLVLPVSLELDKQLIQASSKLKKVDMNESIDFKGILPALSEKLKCLTHLKLPDTRSIYEIPSSSYHLTISICDFYSGYSKGSYSNEDNIDNVFLKVNIEEIKHITLHLKDEYQYTLRILKNLAAAGKKIKVINLDIYWDNDNYIELFQKIFDTRSLESLSIHCNFKSKIVTQFLQDLITPTLKRILVEAPEVDGTKLGELLTEVPSLDSLCLRNTRIFNEFAFTADLPLKMLAMNNAQFEASFLRNILSSSPGISSLEISADPDSPMIKNHKLGEVLLEWLHCSESLKILNFYRINIDREKLDELQEKNPYPIISGETITEYRMKLERSDNPHEPPPSTSETVDADTRPDKKTYHIDRLFIGKPRSPCVEMLRHTVYDTVDFHPNPEGSKNPFILKHASADLHLRPIDLSPSKSSIYEAYQAAENHHYFGRIPLTLSSKWQALPSISANEVLKQYSVDPSVDVEIQRSERDGLFYIRKKGEGTESATLEMLLFAPPPQLKERDLPANIKELIKNYRGFREVDIGELSKQATGEDWLTHIREKRAGSCRHRAVAFKDHMQKVCPDVPARIVRNKCHRFVEINYQGQWLSCDLGGYEAGIKINEGTMPAQAEGEAEISEDAYKLTYSDRGRSYPPGFIQRTKNLMHLKFNQLSRFPIHEDFSHIDTLTITGCQFSAQQLHEFLLRAPNLKTLIITDCTMLPEEFSKLDISGLKQLEYLQLKGAFIPDDAALATILKTVDPKIDVAVEGENFTEEAIVSTSSSSSPDSAPSLLPRTTTAQITPAKKPGAPLPTRYFKPAIAEPVVENLPAWCHRLLNIDVRSVMVDTPQGEALRQQLQQHCHKIKLPCYFINHPDELRCGSHFIKREGKFGKVCKGPGGPLYDFLMQKHPRALVMVNYDRFTPADIARYNALLDEIAFADGTFVPEQYKIIATLNKNDPQVYQGSDLYSRFDAREKAPTIPLEPTSKPPSAEAAPSKQIELCGGGDWESRLIGCWTLTSGNALVFQEGALLKALKAGITQINLNNAPLDDPDFMRFIHDLSLYSGVYHRGELLQTLPPDFNLSFSHAMVFSDKEKLIALNTAPALSDNAELLNQATLTRFLGTYACDDMVGTLALEKGLIELSAGKPLSVYVGMTLDIYTWLKLIEGCREHQVKLNLSFAPGVTLPKELDIAIPESSQLLLAPCTNTRVIASSMPEAWLDAYVTPEPTCVIDISELQPYELFPSIDSKFDDEKGTFHFKNQPGFLLTALASGKTVILTGTASTSMSAALQNFLHQRAKQLETKGSLILLTSEEQAAKYALPLVVHHSDAAEIEPAPPVTIAYEERLTALEQTLAYHPFLILSGPSGIGKTHFMLHDVKDKHHCHFGEDATLQWLEDSRAGIKILFIDEANITDCQWSLFKGLCRKPPAIFYKGKYYPLSPDHKLVFACNPLSYGGERQMPELFKHPQGKTLTFEPLPAQVLREQLITPCLSQCPQEEIISKYILDVVQYMTACSTDTILITPREIEMMALQARLKVSAQPDIDITPWIKQYAHTLARPFVPKKNLVEFDAKFKPVPPPTPPVISLPDFVITKSNQPAVTALLNHLAVRNAKMQGIAASKSGLGGLVLEGEPGIGKSALIKQVLVQQGLKENIDFFVIPVSMSTTEKIQLLLKAFHEGKVVLIDEINSAPMLERVLNALLSGHDLEGKPAANPGFMLIGTQNPVSYRGRLETPLALKHRLQIEKIDSYQRTEMLKILGHMGLPKRIARSMVDELIQASNLNLCFRDLQKCAKQWIAHFGKTQPLTTPIVNPVPQVGSVCKTVALANIENHFANMLGFEPLPLEKRKKAPASIRQIVKQNGSQQGEILTFEQWQKSLTSMGYESDIVAFKNDITQFVDTIAAQLEQGNLPMIGFAVKQDTGLPDPEPGEPEKTEHGAVITGFNRKTDEFTLVHWGKEYVVDATALFLSNNALMATRKPEAYFKNPAWTPEQRDSIRKYLETSTAVPGARVTATPAEASGFKGQLLVVKKPDPKELLKRRAEWLKEHTYLSSSTETLFAKEQKVSLATKPSSAVIVLGY